MPSMNCASLSPWPPLASGISAMIANLAEGEGFEPSGAKSPTRLAVESLKPLGQPSSISPSLSPSRNPVGIEPTRGCYLVPVRGVEPQHSGDQPRESRLIRLLVGFGSCKTLTDRLQTDCLTERNVDGLHTRLSISSARLKGDQCLLVCTQLAATLTVFGVSGWIRTTALLRGDLQSPAFDRSATLTFGLPLRAGPRSRTSTILPQLIHAAADLFQSVRCSNP